MVTSTGSAGKTTTAAWPTPSGTGSTPGTTAGQRLDISTQYLQYLQYPQEAVHGPRQLRDPGGVRLGQGIHQR